MDIDAYLRTPDALRETAAAEGSLLKPGQVFDGFRVLAFLGRGATSEVWRVRDLTQDRDYALKIFAPPPDAPEHARQRFLIEARALDEFRHPNLIRRYRLKEDGEHPYFTMDVLRPLPESMPPRTIPTLCRDLLAALAALHERGLVHRDLKPSNVLIDEKGRAVLADLGAAHVTDPDLAKRLGDTRTPDPTLAAGSSFVGTPRYAAPEQLAGGDVTPATDVYALGVVIEELFGGKVPWAWRGLLRRMTAARPRQRPSVRAVRRRLRLVVLGPKLVRTLVALLAVAATLFAVRLAQPTWVEVTDVTADVITLGGGHYHQPAMRFQPLAEPAPDAVLTATNALDRQFQRMFAARLRRHPVRIQGEGTLRCPDIVGCEIHIAPGVTFVTTGRFTPDGNLIKKPLPPSDATLEDPTGVGYPSFVVEPGARLVFTENAAYPPALIRNPYVGRK